MGNLDLDYKGRAVAGMVAQPVNDYVVGVEIKSRPWILPRVETPSGPPEIPRCRDRHIIRTEKHVVVVEVSTKVTVHPRMVTMAQLRSSAKESVDETGVASRTPDAYMAGIEAIARRLAKKLRQCGVDVR